MQPPSWQETPAPTETPTSAPSPSAVPIPTHTTEVKWTPEPTAEPTDTPASIPTAAPLPTDTPAPTPTAEPTPSPLPTAVPTPLPTSEPTPTADPTATPIPTTAPYLTAEITGTEPAAYGYTTPPAIRIQVTNIGQGTSLPFALALSDGADIFTILPAGTTTLAGGGHTTITVRLAVGLDAGLYTGSLTLHAPGQPDTVLPLLQQVHKAAVLEPAEIRIAAIITDSITLTETTGYEYAIIQEEGQAEVFQVDYSQ